MFLKERQDLIASLIKDQGRVTVTELAKKFEVTEDCIRKDLKKLDAEGRCHRVYGGAVGASELPDRNVFARVNDYRPEKKAIAEKAVHLIKPGQTVFLDISTTNLYLAELIAKKNVRCIVVSNMLDVLKTVAKGPGITAVCPSGNVNLELNGLVGAATLNTIEHMHFDVSFIGAVGLSMEDDSVTTFDMEDGLIKATAMARSTESYLITGSHKFSLVGNYEYARISQFTGIITDDRRLAEVQKIRELGIRVI